MSGFNNKELISDRIKSYKPGGIWKMMGKHIVAKTTNAGYVLPIRTTYIPAGREIATIVNSHKVWGMTPESESMQGTKMVFRTMFVPMNRINPDWDKMKASRAELGANTEAQNNIMPTITIDNECTKSTTFRNSLTARICRIPNNASATVLFNVYEARAFIVAYNELIRNKYSQSMLPEYNTSTVGATEEAMYTQPNATQTLLEIPLDRAENGYFSEVRPEYTSKSGLTADDTRRGALVMVADTATGIVSNHFAADETTIGTLAQVGGDGRAEANVESHIEWHTLVTETMRQATDAQLNDWEVIGLLAQSRPVEADRPQLLSMTIKDMSNNTIIQSSYFDETTGEVTELGKRGSFVGTELEFETLKARKFIQDGILVETATIYVNNEFETGIPRTTLMTKMNDWYKPTKDALMIDAMLDWEVSAERGITGDEDIEKGIVGIKKKWSEWDEDYGGIDGDMRSYQLTNPVDNTLTPTTNYLHYAKRVNTNAATGVTIENVTVMQEDINVVNRNLVFQVENNAYDSSPQQFFILNEREVWKRDANVLLEEPMTATATKRGE